MALPTAQIFQHGTRPLLMGNNGFGGLWPISARLIRQEHGCSPVSFTGSQGSGIASRGEFMQTSGGTQTPLSHGMPLKRQQN